jgi:hypothetical protein
MFVGLQARRFIPGGSPIVRAAKLMKPAPETAETASQQWKGTGIAGIKKTTH